MVYIGSNDIYEGCKALQYPVFQCSNILCQLSMQCSSYISYFQKETPNLIFHGDLETLYSLVEISRWNTGQYCTVCYWSLVNLSRNVNRKSNL